MHRFEAPLVRPGGTGTWTYVNVPAEIGASFAAKSRLPVLGTIDGVAYRSSLMPRGDGTFFIVVNQALRDAVGKTAGDLATVTVERDAAERTVEAPDDLARALEANPEAKAAFEVFSYSHRKEYVAWIAAAKKAETRAGRIEKAVGMIAEKRRLK